MNALILKEMHSILPGMDVLVTGTGKASVVPSMMTTSLQLTCVVHVEVVEKKSVLIVKEMHLILPGMDVLATGNGQVFVVPSMMMISLQQTCVVPANKIQLSIWHKHQQYNI